MASVNKVILLGALGRDPESRALDNGDRVVSFSMATSESWKDKTTGERKENTTWHNIVIFNQALGKIAEDYLKKGSKVYIEGKMQTRKYTDRDSNERTITEVVLTQFKGEIVLLGDKQNRDGDADQTPTPRQQESAPGHAAAIIDDSDIPF